MADPELAALARRRDAAPDFGLFSQPTVEEAVQARDAVLGRAEAEQVEWVRRGRAAMVALWQDRARTDARGAYVAAHDLAAWCDREGYTHDKRKLAPVFVGKGSPWVCIGRVPNPRRHASLTPAWSLNPQGATDGR